MVKTYDRTLWEVTWEDDSTDTFTHDSSYGSNPKWGENVTFKEFDGTYERGLIRKRTRLSFKRYKQLNWRHIKALEPLESQERTV